MREKSQELAKIFKALSDVNRLKILSLVYKKGYKCGDKVCVKDFSSLLNITLPTVSHHVKELANAKLLTPKKQGRWVYCQIDKDTISELKRFLSSFISKT